MDKKDLAVKQSDQLSLARTDGLLAITNKLLARRDNQGLVESDTWLDELIAWADENDISEYRFPRYKQKILALTVLDLEGNVLDSEGNNLSKIPDSIGNLHNLTKLDLSSINLSEIPDSIGNLHSLTKLDLSYNNLRKIPDGIANLQNLTELGLNHNNLTKIPDCIINFTNLTQLSLSENQSLKLTTEQKQWLIELKNNGCTVYVDNFEEIIANNEIIKSDNQDFDDDVPF